MLKERGERGIAILEILGLEDVSVALNLIPTKKKKGEKKKKKRRRRKNSTYL